MSSVVFQTVTKRFKDVLAVDRVSFGISEGEFFVIVGPTACGKTTLLRLIAGFIKPESGDILIGGRKVNDVPPKDRGVRMVFQGQDYALWPHLKIFDADQYSNLSFSLKIRKLAPGRIRNVVSNVAHQVGIDPDTFSRKPVELSQGQKQRVAIGRALTVPPKVHLFDEPLTNLDPPNRYKVMKELLRIHRELNSTTIYVTHNLIEAVALADRMAVMKEGRILQIGSPKDIRDHPNNDFVADFLKYSDINYYEAVKLK